MFVLCSAAIPLLVLSRSPSNIHHTHASSTQRAICGKTSYSSLPPALCHQRGLAWPLWHQHCHNYGVLNHQYDISQSRHAKCQAGPLGLSLLLSERREKWRFVYRWIIIAIGIYEAHQAFFAGEDAAFEGDSGVHLIRRRTQWNKTLRQPVSAQQAF